MANVWDKLGLGDSFDLSKVQPKLKLTDDEPAKTTATKKPDTIFDKPSFFGDVARTVADTGLGYMTTAANLYNNLTQAQYREGGTPIQDRLIKAHKQIGELQDMADKATLSQIDYAEQQRIQQELTKAKGIVDNVKAGGKLAWNMLTNPIDNAGKIVGGILDPLNFAPVATGAKVASKLGGGVVPKIVASAGAGAVSNAPVNAIEEGAFAAARGEDWQKAAAAGAGGGAVGGAILGPLGPLVGHAGEKYADYQARMNPEVMDTSLSATTAPLLPHNGEVVDTYAIGDTPQLTNQKVVVDTTATPQSLLKTDRLSNLIENNGAIYQGMEGWSEPLGNRLQEALDAKGGRDISGIIDAEVENTVQSHIAGLLGHLDDRASMEAEQVRAQTQALIAGGADRESVTRAIDNIITVSPDDISITNILNDGKPLSSRMMGVRLLPLLENSIRIAEETPHIARTNTEFAAALKKEGVAPELGAAMVNAYAAKDPSILQKYMWEKINANRAQIVDEAVVRARVEDAVAQRAQIEQKIADSTLKEEPQQATIQEIAKESPNIDAIKQGYIKKRSAEIDAQANEQISYNRPEHADRIRTVADNQKAELSNRFDSGIQKLSTAWENKDFSAINNALIDGLNFDYHKKAIGAIYGVNFGKTKKDARDAVVGHFGDEFLRWEDGQKKAYADEQAKNKKNELARRLSDKVKYNGAVMTTKEWLDAVHSNGFTRIDSKKVGATNRYEVANGQGEHFRISKLQADYIEILNNEKIAEQYQNNSDIISNNKQGAQNGKSEAISTDKEPLERVSTEDVRGVQKGGDIRREDTGGGDADARGDGEPRGGGVRPRDGVGDDTGEVHTTKTRGERDGRDGERESKDDAGTGRNTARDDSGERLAQSAPAKNFTITDDAPNWGGEKTKAANNIEAIRLLKQIKKENRPATSEEQATLSKYIGWGGLANAFVKPDGSVAKGWSKEATLLKEILSDEEYKAARASTPNAHYTDYKVVSSIYDALSHMGFHGGDVLEPSMGVGNFFGLMPKDMAAASKLRGVELDTITGEIAKLLYPKSDIQIKGFQEFKAPDNYFDAVIGNPPFGKVRLFDKERKELNNMSIHNYFIAKSVDLAKPDGIVAMVTSSFFMDAADAKTRNYIASKADLVGAIRLPNDAFKTAGTEVVTDIVFLRKRKEGEAPGENQFGKIEYVQKDGEEYPINEYFAKHPDMMLGELSKDTGMYGGDGFTLVRRSGDDIPTMLSNAIKTLPKDIIKSEAPKIAEEVYTPKTDKLLSAKNGSMFVDENGNVHIKSTDAFGNAISEKVELEGKPLERVKGLIAIRDILDELRQKQLGEYSDAELMPIRERLNKTYDAFVKKYEPINSQSNKTLFADDPTWPHLSALEKEYDKGLSRDVAKKTGEAARPKTAKKTDIFFKRTQWPYSPPKSAATAKDALIISLSEKGRVDNRLISELLGGKEDFEGELKGLVFKNPNGGFETREQYLSGNVKEKLKEAREAAKSDDRYYDNVRELEAVQPKDIEAVDIETRLGTHWVMPSVYADFMKEVLGVGNPSAYHSRSMGQWEFDGRASASAQMEFGTDRVSAVDIMQATANQKSISIYDTIGSGKDATKVFNEAATNAAIDKAEKIKTAWRRWIYQDDARREMLSTYYNERFNTDAIRRFDGSHLTLPGKVDDSVIALRPHQKDGIWRITQSQNTLLDHVVGAGKTFTIIGAAMELRRMGLAKKPMIVVPNHLVGQWAEDFIKLYPGANILAATKKDFEAKNRKAFVNKITTNDWDAVIIAHSSFGKIELDPQFESDFITAQIDAIKDEIVAQQEAQGKSANTKRLEDKITSLEERLKKRLDALDKDDNLHWRDTGVDALFVDEAHEFKNLFFYTGMQKVAGLGNPQGSNKALDLYMKVRQLQEGNGKVVFATGTPISNTMAEMYTLQRYLDPDRVRSQGWEAFDAWAGQFGEVVTDWELTPTGKYKMNSRFAKFVNMPELMQSYLGFADVINRDDINRQLAATGGKLPIPKIKGGMPQNTVVERSEAQAKYFENLIKRAENLPKGKKAQEKGADNMLKVFSDGRKAALDARLVMNVGDFERSKVNTVAENVKRLYDAAAGDKGTQLVFCDLSTPKSSRGKERARIKELYERADNGDEAAAAELERISPDEIEAALDEGFDVYSDLRQKLINKGIPAKEIAYIHEANTELQKEELFGKVRSGQVRVLIGSTAKMGAGMNVQERLVALHHLDAPWKPSDLEQREGRIIRQGNKLYEKDPEGFQVEIHRYATEATTDSMMWQILEGKSKFIEQVRKGNVKDRSVEDVGMEAMNAAQMKAAASGDPRIFEEMTLRTAIRKLDGLMAEHDREQFRLKDKMRQYEAIIQNYPAKLEAYAVDIETISKAGDKFEINISGKKYDKRVEAGDALLAMLKEGKEIKSKYKGLELKLDKEGDTLYISLEGKEYHPASSSATISELEGVGLIARIENTAKAIQKNADALGEAIESAKKELPKMASQVREFERIDEYNELKQKHRAILDSLKEKEKPDTNKLPQDEVC